MKTYVICTTLEENSISTLKRIKDGLDLKNANVHIVTIFETHVYNVDLVPYIFPTEAQYGEIENASKPILKSLARSIGADEKSTITQCFFSSDREKRIKNYLNEVEADLVITATRGKHGIDGLFSSSFTDYLCKFSPCDVLVMRPLKV
jgi:nucleotide-binding universal stress UspA family protein